MSARKTMRVGASDSGFAENDTGTGPATPVSPTFSAHQNRKEEYQPVASYRFWAAATELTRRDIFPVDPISSEEEDSPDFEVMKIFRRKIAGLRRLPRQQSAQAIRAALEWLWSTMAGLRDKRAYARRRHARTTSPPAWPSPSKSKPVPAA
jgi:hypothetical protein